MPTKHPQRTYPYGLDPGDFKCYGPPACEDTLFIGTKMADFGCFNQDSGVDSNKYYHACVCSDPKSRWYKYIEYGREGAGNPSFQFTECSGESEAISEYIKQCEDKNTKRGEWGTVGGLRRYVPKVKKGKPEDLYVLRDMAVRKVGLPDGRGITSVNHVATAQAPKKTGKKTYRCDAQTTKLFRDLIGGAVSFTRASIQGGALPTQRAINDSRTLLQNALLRVGTIGSDVNVQVADTDLRAITKALYSSIPKIKPLGAPEKDWILSQDNIIAWQQDLDAFETALKSGSADIEVDGDDPLEGFPLDMEWIDPKSDLGSWLMRWWPAASNKRNGYGDMKIVNLWKVIRHGNEEADFRKYQERILSEMGPKWKADRPLFQEKDRFDLSSSDRDLWWRSNSALTFHGSRSVNIPGILRENLRLPGDLVGVVITGAMFGPGNYFADDWQKSAGYTSLNQAYYNSGGGSVKGRHAFMFACDTVMGNPHYAPESHGFTTYPKGTHCIYGKAGHTRSWHTNKLLNNEWITFDRKPVLRYLAEFTTQR